MPQQKDYPNPTLMTALRLDADDLAIVARIRAMHPYLKGQAMAIRLALHYWHQQHPELPAEQPRREINISRGTID